MRYKKTLKLLYFFVFLLIIGCHKKELPVKKTTIVKVTKPLVKNVDLFLSYVGHLQPTIQVEVKAQVEGVLTGYYFTEGSEVKQGNLIFTIDSRPYEAQLQKAEGALAQSIANLRYAEDVAKRNVRLAQEDYVAQVQFDQYITNVLTNKAEIKQNEADIETAKINISYCNIHAPITGVTSFLKINVGNLIENAGETPLITLNQITPIYSYFSVPQKDLSKIMQLHRKEPLLIHVFLNGNYDYPFEGKLDLINNEVNDQTGSIWLRGIFKNEEKILWPGEFVDVHLITGRKENAILVPTQAVSLGQKGKYVFVIKDNDIAQMKLVKTAQRIGNMTLIEDGIDPDDLVVVEGQINLSSGSKVSIKSIGNSG